MKFIIFALFIAAICAENLIITQEHTDYLKNHVSWEVVDYEDNIFRGWSVEEAKTLLGDEDKDIIPKGIPIQQKTIPSDISWRGDKCVHEILNQRNCGSCWAFTTASVVSDLCCLQQKQDHGVLAPQELISCDKGNEGCNGGLASTALEYVQNNGLVPETCFPYEGINKPCPNACSEGSNWNEAHVCKCKTLLDCGTVEGMHKCLANGPITIRMLTYSDFYYYKSGIYCWDKKSQYLGGHAIRGIGYGDGFFECANSWGKYWGDNGYFKISDKEGCGCRITPHDAWAVKDC